MSASDSKEFASCYETPPEKVCMVSEERKIQMQKGELTRAMNIWFYAVLYEYMRFYLYGLHTFYLLSTISTISTIFKKN